MSKITFFNAMGATYVQCDKCKWSSSSGKAGPMYVTLIIKDGIICCPDCEKPL